MRATDASSERVHRVLLERGDMRCACRRAAVASMTGPAPRPQARHPMAHDGDELRFCTTCAFSAACMESGYDKEHLRDLHVMVEHVGPYREGQHVFREGDSFNAIAAVRAGTVKTYVNDADGREQVLGSSSSACRGATLRVAFRPAGSCSP